MLPYVAKKKGVGEVLANVIEVKIIGWISIPPRSDRCNHTYLYKRQSEGEFTPTEDKVSVKMEQRTRFGKLALKAGVMAATQS